MQSSRHDSQTFQHSFMCALWALYACVCVRLFRQRKERYTLTYGNILHFEPLFFLKCLKSLVMILCHIHLQMSTCLPILIWTEITSFIKGSEHALTKGFLDKDSYIKVGRKQATNFTVNDREKVKCPCTNIINAHIIFSLNSHTFVLCSILLLTYELTHIHTSSST